VDIDEAAYYYGELDDDGRFQGLGLFRCLRDSGFVDYYFGDWMNGEPHGRGMKVSDDNCYEGEFRFSRCEGYGSYVCPEETYRGEWKNDEKHGKGVVRFPDGGMYEGEFTKGGITGYGCFTWVAGDSLTSHFEDGMACGRGLLKWNDGVEFEGNFANNKREGEGFIRFPDGRLLTANYVGDERRGPAKMEWPSGDVWIGEFLTRNTARGVRTFAETGDTLEGVFTDYELQNGGDEKTGTWMTYTTKSLSSDGSKQEVVLGIWKDERFIPKDEIMKTDSDLPSATLSMASVLATNTNTG